MRTHLLAATAAALLLAAAPTPAQAWCTLTAPAATETSTGPLVAAVGLVSWALVGWLLLTALLTAGGSLRGPVGAVSRAAVRRVAPQAVRRVVALALGLTVVLGVSGTAQAASVLPTPPAAAASLDWPRAPAAAGPTLDWPAVGESADAATGAPGGDPTRPTGETVLVRPGDSLWRLAAEHLPAGAPAAAVAAAWPTWWSANRQLLGDEPDLLQPGSRLVVPLTARAAGRSAP